LACHTLPLFCFLTCIAPLLRGSLSDRLILLSTHELHDSFDLKIRICYALSSLLPPFSPGAPFAFKGFETEATVTPGPTHVSGLIVSVKILGRPLPALQALPSLESYSSAMYFFEGLLPEV